MKKIIFILAAIFFISDCSADARVLEQLRAKSSAKAKHAVSKIKKSKKKAKHESCIVKNTKPKEIVTKADLDIRDDLAYLPNEDKPFTGKHEQYHSNGKKYIVTNYKDGKKNGLLIMWDEYENQVAQLSYIDGEPKD
jgi:antitoxin component YwqK of YwqJK toxin-antitoxin module